MKLDEYTIKELSKFNQRQLKDGEVVLLAKCIAFALPLNPEGMTSIKMYVLTHKSRIYGVTDCIQQYAYLSEEQEKSLYEYVGQFLLWRYHIANGSQFISFTSGPEGVIDDITGILEYVGSGTLCSLTDISNHITATHTMFNSIVNSCLVDGNQ